MKDEEYPPFYDEYEAERRKRYPVERCVMKKEKRDRFVTKCKELGKPKSRVINELIDKLLAGEVTL